MGRETERLVGEAGARGVFVVTDVADAASVAALVDDRRSPGSAVCTAPSTPPPSRTRRRRCTRCDDDAFDRMQAVNVRGVFLSMKHEIAAMLANEPP